MKFNKWTVGLAAVGVVSLASAARADEQMSVVNTALTQTTLSGYVDTAMQWNPGTDRNPGSASFAGTGIDGHGTPSGGVNVPAYAFAKDDGFSLNAVDLALDKPEDSSAWAAGYHVELMAGSDSVGVGVSGSLALRQAFIRLHTPVGGNGIDWQVGIWDNIIGYESNSDPLNPNYTRSYGYSIEPTTMTGVLATYKVNDMVSISAGIADNDGGLGSISPTFTGNSTAYESQRTYMADATFTAPDSMGFLKGGTMSVGFVHGADSALHGNGTENSLYAGLTIPTPMNQLKVGAAFDYLWETDATTAGDTSIGGDDIWVVGLYGTFQATDKLSFNVRAEYVTDDSNYSYSPGSTGETTTSGTVTADAVHLYSYGSTHDGKHAEELTATVQYQLWANVMSRAEFRWDHVEHGDWFGANGNSAGESYGAPDKNNDFLLALNLIYQF